MRLERVKNSIGEEFSITKPTNCEKLHTSSSVLDKARG